MAGCHLFVGSTPVEIPHSEVQPKILSNFIVPSSAETS